MESSWRLFFAGTSIVVLTHPTYAQVARAEPGASLLPPVTITSPDPAAKKRAQRSERPARTTSVRRSAQRGRPASLQPILPGVSGALVVSPGRGDVSGSVTALPAATTTLDAPRISQLPVATYGDLFRSLPGFNVSNFGQGAIGYGLSLRGYTEAEHGRDIAYYIDGVPVNEVSSLHTPNYADLNILPPESVKSVEIVRGPFAVEYGDSKSRRLRQHHHQDR